MLKVYQAHARTFRFFGILELTLQEFVRPLNPVIDVVLVVRLDVNDVGSLVVLRPIVEQRTGLGECQRCKQVDEEHDQQENDEATHVLVYFLFCTDCGPLTREMCKDHCRRRWSLRRSILALPRREFAVRAAEYP